MDKEITGISFGGVVYQMTRSDSTYEVEAKEAFAKEMVNPLKAIDNTIGGMRRKELHDALDEWIDTLIKRGENENA